jgi:hypothetical protein
VSRPFVLGWRWSGNILKDFIKDFRLVGETKNKAMITG